MKKTLSILLSSLLCAGLAACSPAESASTPQPTQSAQPTAAPSGTAAPQSTYTAGTYTAESTGNSGTVTVEVTFGSETIDGIKILSHTETDHLMYAVEQLLPERILSAQSLAVDSVSGATISSAAVLNAVKDCVEQAGGSVDQLLAKAESAPTVETADCEVLVIGSGPSGLMTALTLQDAGVDVLLIEMQDITGGSGRYSAGRMFGTLSDGDYERIYAAFMKQTTANPQEYDAALFPNGDKVEQYLTEGTELFHYMQDELGYSLEYYDAAETKVHVYNNKFENYSSSKGFQLTESLTEDYLSRGGDLRLRTTATSLLQDEQGNVIGAEAATSTGTLTIHAGYTVVATGSAAYNQEMQALYIPEKADGEQRVISMGSNGSGIQMMLDAGAQIIPSWINSTSTYSTHPQLARTRAAEVVTELSDTQFASTLAVSSELFVDETGARLGNEANSFISLSYYKAGRIDSLFAVIDSAQAESLGLLETLESGVASDPEHFFKADTLEALSDACGFDSVTFLSTVETYNSACAAGEDKEFGKPAEKLVALETGPFYAVNELLINRDLAGGVYTDLNRQVLDTQGNVIGGLFAVGFSSSRDLYASGIPGASSVGEAVVTGRVAGSYLAQELNK